MGAEPFEGGTQPASSGRKFDPESAWRVLIGGVLDCASNAAKRKLPPAGIFQKFSVGLYFPGEREIHGVLFVEPGSNKNTRVVRVGVHRSQSDRLISNCFFFSSSQEVTDWLAAEETVPLLVSTYRQLRERLE